MESRQQVVIALVHQTCDEQTSSQNNTDFEKMIKRNQSTSRRCAHDFCVNVLVCMYRSVVVFSLNKFAVRQKSENQIELAQKSGLFHSFHCAAYYHFIVAIYFRLLFLPGQI